LRVVKDAARGLTWAKDLAKRAGRAMKTARASNTTAAWLSERTAKLGYRVSPSVIAKLESGHRGDVLSVAELCVLAAALEVPPVALLFPELPDGNVELFPGMWFTSDDALRWFCGESGTLPFDVLVGGLEDSEYASPDLLAPNAKAQLVNAVRDRHAYFRDALKAESDDRYRHQLPDLVNRVREENAKIRALGGVVRDDRWAITHSADGGVDA
jgi:transcriptional regulator with XRE-family HTH domain